MGRISSLSKQLQRGGATIRELKSSIYRKEHSTLPHFPGFLCRPFVRPWIGLRNPVCIRNDTVVSYSWCLSSKSARPLSACNWLRLEDWIWIVVTPAEWISAFARIVSATNSLFQNTRHFVKLNYPRSAGVIDMSTIENQEGGDSNPAVELELPLWSPFETSLSNSKTRNFLERNDRLQLLISSALIKNLFILNFLSRIQGTVI